MLNKKIGSCLLVLSMTTHLLNEASIAQAVGKGIDKGVENITAAVILAVPAVIGTSLYKKYISSKEKEDKRNRLHGAAKEQRKSIEFFTQEIKALQEKGNLNKQEQDKLEDYQHRREHQVDVYLKTLTGLKLNKAQQLKDEATAYYFAKKFANSLPGGVVCS